MSPHVHFAALVSPDYDMDLLPHWIVHYKCYRFDSYKVFLHSPFENEDLLYDAKQLFEHEGFEVETLGHEIFGNGMLRSSVMRKHSEKFGADDRLVTADSDEFQHVPENYRSLCEEYEVILGRHVDRYDTTLHDARPNIPLSAQFPLSGDVQALVMDTVDVGTRQRWPKMRKEKIMCSCVKYPVAFGGSHTFYPFTKEKLGTPREYPFTFEVWHYPWRASLVKRLSGKEYNRAEHIWYYKRFFNAGKPPCDPELDKIIELEEGLQKEGYAR